MGIGNTLTAATMFFAVASFPGLPAVANDYATDHPLPPATARLTRYHVKPQYREAYRRILSEYVFSSLKADGNIMAEAYFEPADSANFWIIERWIDRNSLEHNEKSKTAKAISTLVETGLLSPVETIFVNDLEPLSKEAYRRAPKAGDHPITVMLFVDAKDGTQENFRKIYHDAMPQFRSEPGVITYQLSQVQEEDTKFITYEKFRDAAAFQYHLKFPPIKPVIDWLHTSIKDPPFEKGIHNLIEFAPLYQD